MSRQVVIAYLSQYIDKSGPTQSIKVEPVAHIRPAKYQKTSSACGIFNGKIALKKYSREEYEMLMTQRQ